MDKHFRGNPYIKHIKERRKHHRTLNELAAWSGFMQTIGIAILIAIIIGISKL